MSRKTAGAPFARETTLFFARLIAGLLFLIAVIGLVSDVTRASQGERQAMVSLGETWQGMAPASLQAARTSVKSLHPALWDYGIAGVLKLPTWLAFALLGCLFAFFGRRRRRTNIFAN